MPLVSKNFSDIITFTRASTGTYFDSAGVLQSAAIDAPRFDYNPATLAAQGLLIEEARTNVLLYSEELNNVSFWTPQQASITANATTSPSNTLTADKLVEDTSTNIHTNYCFPTGPAAGTPFTVSIFAKASERTAFAIDVRASGIGFRSVFDLTAVTATGAVITSGTLVSTSITSVGNGWFRCSVTGSHPSATQYNVTFRLNNPAGTDSYTGNGTSGMFFWGAQMETGAFPTSYIPTTTTALTRSADVASVNTLSPWFNATEGSIYVDFAGRQAGIQPYLTMFSNTGETERIYQRYVGGQYQTIARVAGTDIASVYNSTEGSAVNAKIASAYNASQLATSTNGQAVTGLAVASLSNVPSGLNRLWLGSFTGTSAFANGYLRRIVYYPRRLSNAELQAITA